MKLSKYLADYLQHEAFNYVDIDEYRNGTEVSINVSELQKVIQQGIEAFESTENARVNVCFEDVTCEHSFIDADNDGIYGNEVCRFCGWRRHK